MKQIVQLTIIVIVAMLVLASFATADVPQLINYQGRLTNTNGGPVASNPYQMKFIIYDAATGGTELWNSGFQTVNVADGLFDVKLGESPMPALPDDLFDTDTIRYLGITVGADSELAPRSRFTTVAFAYKALRSDSAGIALSVAANTIGPPAIIDGSITSTDIDNSSVQERISGSAPSGEYITAVNADGSVVTSPDQGGGWIDDGATVRLETASDKVGIGTSSPTYNLDIEGGGTAFRITGGGASWPKLKFDVETGGYPVMKIYDGTATEDFRFNTDSTTPNSWLNGPGNVGIGNRSPSQKLHVSGTIYSSTGGFKFPDGTDQITASLGDITAAYAGGGLAGGGTSGSVTLYVPTGGITGTHIATNTITTSDIATDGVGSDEITDGSIQLVDLGFTPNDDDWTISGINMYSAVSGSVGIGTTNPSSKLTVQGNIRTFPSSGPPHTTWIGTSSTTAGYIATYGPNGNLNARFNNYSGISNFGHMGVYNGNAERRAGVYVNNLGIGQIATFGPNGNANVNLTSFEGYNDHGAVTVKDYFGVDQAGMYVNEIGFGVAFSDIHGFRSPNPKQQGTEIIYASIGGPEAAAYVRGTGHLANGSVEITLPDHFVAIANSQGITVQLTPLSADSKGLAVTEKSVDRIVVQELSKGNGTYDFDYIVTAARKGHEDYQVIRPTLKMVPPEAEAVDESIEE